ncbi:MAG: phage terminase large subunit family protein [Alphaproteobacteria bacterium]|nr:phage terminase large subunit family protein [Alphaproteobacteria bacterium]MBU2152906.1 phage terminase large subunit family protein [Alphaproteobacteria bacterium]MBU2364749.1 phage terminase large subunit family protein [Alphaproteobacteria bacterium]
MSRRKDMVANLGVALAEARLRLAGDALTVAIGRETNFVDWVTSISQDRVHPATGRAIRGLRVDGAPFSLEDRPAMRWVYEQLPSTLDAARNSTVIVMKCSQVGFTVMEMLYALFLTLKFEPLKLGFYLPDQALARGKSSIRFLPIARTIPEAYEKLIAPPPDALHAHRSEGNVMTRTIGSSTVHFLWTSGKATTESYPMDVVSFDEVQEMLVSDMEKVRERLSASRIKLTLMGSTANWPDADIDYWYQRGSQHRFHTTCPTCRLQEPLDDYFPHCIKFDPEFPDRITGTPGDYRYVCRDGHWIDDPQAGVWIASDHDAAARKIVSIHFHQMLSPTISPREMYEAYVSGDDRKNFFNRKLGKPYQDPNQVPVTLAHLNACAAEGMARGLSWKASARETFMGIDQMGGFNVVIIKERLTDGKQAVVHIEFVYGEEPFARCDELMDVYGVQVCVVEQLPNFNDALRFANRHRGRVFLCNSYTELADGLIAWSDAARQNASERRTAEDEQTRYTVRVDQYRMMQVALRRLVDTQCLFPDPQALVQHVREKGIQREVAILKDVAFVHFQKTALVTERVNDGERKLRRKVVKVGIDPHASFANMLCDVAWARAYGTATFLLLEPALQLPTEARQNPIVQLIHRRCAEGTCGGCSHFELKDGQRGERGIGRCEFRSTHLSECTVRDADPQNDCPGYEPSITA